jgi:DNA-binding IclR family transcriptional regulator
VPEKTVKLSPFAALRERGHLYNIAKSAARALDILELLAGAEGPLRAVEIGRSLALSPSSANQVLKTMMDGGYLIFDPVSKRYHLSARLAGLAASLSANYFRPGALDGLMRSVQKATGGIVILAAAQDLFMQIMDICEPAHPQAGPGDIRQTQQVKKGLRTPFFGSCTGAAWLSSQSDQTILRLSQKCRRDLGRQANDIDGILERIHRVREQGYAFGGMMADDGIWSVAVPLPPTANGIILVLVVSGPAETIDEKKADIAALMKKKIRRFLGKSATAQPG